MSDPILDATKKVEILRTALRELLTSAECLKEALDAHNGYCGEPISFLNARKALGLDPYGT